MAAIVNKGFIQFGGSSNQVGVFSGQNMQNGWDSHSPNLSVLGTMLGPFSVQAAAFAQLNNSMLVGQPILSQELKDNASPLFQGP